jgi:hypothetical protein
MYTGRNTKEGYAIDFYDMDWNYCNISYYLHGGCVRHCSPIVKPDGFEEMKRISKKLSKNFSFIRVDLYNVDGKIYFGELTFFPTAGYFRLLPKSIDEELARLIKY